MNQRDLDKKRKKDQKRRATRRFRTRSTRAEIVQREKEDWSFVPKSFMTGENP
jgi:hypothetical protein